MKKYYFLIIGALILGLALTGCLVSNVGQVPSSEQSGIASLTRASVTPTLVDPWESGNAAFECGQVDCCEADYAYKVDAAAPNGTYKEKGNTITIFGSDGYTFDWASNYPVSCVIVKASTSAFVYCYPAGVYSDSGLVAPGGKDISHVTFCFGDLMELLDNLDVEKTAVGSYERDITWELDKSVDDDYHSCYAGETCGSSTWTVVTTKTISEPHYYKVSGEITIINPNDVPVAFLISDTLDDGTPVTVNCPSGTVPANGSITCTYEAFPVYTSAILNTVIVTFNDGKKDIDVQATAPVAFTEEILIGDEEVTLSDPRFDYLQLISASTTKTFSEDFGCSADEKLYDEHGYYQYVETNTAYLDGGHTDLEASASVTVDCYREVLTVTKTAETYYERIHDWSIDKSVETENKYTHDELPKIWLYINGDGDETATWTVDVTYESYEDGNYNISGTITILNNGSVDAVINSIGDALGGTSIDLDCDVTLPYTLAAGASLNCSYSEDIGSKIAGYNEVTVTTERDVYSAKADLIWDPEPNSEVNATVNIQDISDLFDSVNLGTATAPNNEQFTYTKDFAWEDYGKDNCGDFSYDNTATIVETGQEADATLLVNVQCYIYETAYARMGDDATCFIPTFNNWGWTNLIGSGYYGTWDLWAAAGQCDIWRGTLVGSVTVDYTGDCVDVTYNVVEPYSLDETHVYAGCTMFPQVKQGKKTVSTVAPGQYYETCPLECDGDLYVIAHAVVGIPDPDFGP